VSYQQPPFDSATVRQRRSQREKDRLIIAGTVVGVVVMLGLGAWAVYAITSSKSQPVAGDRHQSTPAAASVDPLAAAAAQQFTDAVANDDVAAAKLVVCSSEAVAPAGVRVPYEIKKLTVNGTTGSLVLVKHPSSTETVQIPALRLVKQNGGWKICGTV
jgi:hypothetical protein